MLARTQSHHHNIISRKALRKEKNLLYEPGDFCGLSPIQIGNWLIRVIHEIRGLKKTNIPTQAFINFYWSLFCD